MLFENLYSVKRTEVVICMELKVFDVCHIFIRVLHNPLLSRTSAGVSFSSWNNQSFNGIEVLHDAPWYLIQDKHTD